MTYPTSSDWQALYQSIKELRKSQKESQKKHDKEMAELRESKKEHDKEMAELRESQKELRESQKETDRQMKETDKKMKRTDKQISGIGEKFGYFTEGMALPSMEKILRNQFKMEVVSPCITVRNKKTGEEKEIDVLAYANSDINQVFVVEIKSKLKNEGIKQIKKTLKEFFELFPEHKGKQVFGVIAAVDSKPRSLMKERVLEEGLYYAEISDETFTLKVPKGFRAKAWR